MNRIDEKKMTMFTRLPYDLPLTVLAFQDGHRARGYLLNFSPTSERCQFFASSPQIDQWMQTRTSDESVEPPACQGEWVDLRKLKAIFFIRKFALSASRNLSHSGGASYGRKMEIEFLDRERLRGTVTSYSADRTGFFFTPDDTSRQIERAFVINQSVRQVVWLNEMRIGLAYPSLPGREAMMVF